MAATGEPIDPSLLTDGLRAEREQGITIDLAWRTLTTARRRFVLADAPGHVDFLRNVATGASTADAALLVIDARTGPKEQTRRHAAVAALMGVPCAVMVVNKLDLVGFDAGSFHAAETACLDVARRVGFERVTCIPVSALHGDNVVRPSPRIAWWHGPTLLEELETLAPERGAEGPLRFPVQLVLRAPHGGRGLAGTIAAGTIRPGDEVMIQPAGRRARVSRVATFDGDLPAASAGRAVVVFLADDVDVARGELLARPEQPAQVSQRFLATALWFCDVPLTRDTSFLVRHATGVVSAHVEAVLDTLDVETLCPQPAARVPENAIGRVVLALQRPIPIDPYAFDRTTGAVALIDPITNATTGVGVVLEANLAGAGDPRRGRGTAKLLGRAATLWLTGLPAAGKTTLAKALCDALIEEGLAAAVLDGDVLRAGLSRDLGFSPMDRAEQVRRAAEVARLMNEAGVVSIVALVSPEEAAREAARRIVGPERFTLCWVSTTLEVCRRRDPKGHYARAEAGALLNFTGVSSPYEQPIRPDVVVDTNETPLDVSVRALRDALAARLSLD